MTLIIVETDRSDPITPEVLADEGNRAFPCLAARNVTWRYSLLSSDRRRMICSFDAPDAEAVRMSYRTARVPFEKMWVDDLLEPSSTPAEWNESALILSEMVYPGGLSQSEWQAQWKIITQHLLPRLAERGVEWVRSHVSPNQTLILSELNAPDPALIDEAYRQCGLPLARLWPAMLLKP
ncbi:MAG: nickel-binding protein [Cyanobacteriota bacterium]